MEHLFQLLGLLLPDTRAVFGVKVLVAGIVGTSAGLLVMASGIDGMIVYGGGIAACGFALTVLSARILAREVHQEEAERNEQQLTREAEVRGPEAQADEVRGQKLKGTTCDGHDYCLDDGALNCNVATWLCRKCGAVRVIPPRHGPTDNPLEK